MFFECFEESFKILFPELSVLLEHGRNAFTHKVSGPEAVERAVLTYNVTVDVAEVAGDGVVNEVDHFCLVSIAGVLVLHRSVIECGKRDFVGY